MNKKPRIPHNLKPMLRTTGLMAAGMAMALTFASPVLGQSIEDMEKQGWKLTFQDEFNGNKLDPAKWNTAYYHGKIVNHELQAYTKDAFKVTDGVMNIVAEKKKATYDGKAMEYTSGVMTTLGKFEQEYGYFEARCKVPYGVGFWPAFWMLSSSLTWPPEIDIFEYIGHEKNIIHCTSHWRDAASGKHQAEAHQVDAMMDYSAGFHNYAVEWEPGKITWYVDAQPVAVCKKEVPKGKFYLILNLAVGGDWPGTPGKDAVFPNSFAIDYVRGYSRADAGPKTAQAAKP
jgi:beta-glucanase (GH16 family)